MGFFQIFYDYLKKTGEVGYVEQVVGPIVHASGLPGVKPEELVEFAKDKMKSEVKSEVAGMIQMSLEKVLGKALDSKMQQKLVEESVKTIKS